MAGAYVETEMRNVPPGVRATYFEPGLRKGEVVFRQPATQKLSFERKNLLKDPAEGTFDLILCRNVMIYFDKPTQLGVLERFAPLLRPEGLLFAGHSESFHNAAHLFKLRGKTVYGLARPVPVDGKTA